MPAEGGEIMRAKILEMLRGAGDGYISGEEMAEKLDSVS